MHEKDPFSEFREFINTMESRVQELGKAYGVEHLAGPQGFAVRYLFENQDKEIFIKDIEKRLSNNCSWIASRKYPTSWAFFSPKSVR